MLCVNENIILHNGWVFNNDRRVRPRAQVIMKYLIINNRVNGVKGGWYVRLSLKERIKVESKIKQFGIEEQQRYLS